MKYLGAYLDESFTLKHRITEKCKTASINLIRIKNIRKLPHNKKRANTLMLGLVIVLLEPGNALFAWLPKVDIQRLQRVQDMAAKNRSKARTKYDSATAVFEKPYTGFPFAFASNIRY